MKLTILGSGTCVSGFPKVKDRFPPAFLLELKDTKILFECSEGVRFRLNQVGTEYTEIEHICLSHSHPDHFALVHFIQSVFLKGLWFGKNFRRDKIFIYCPKQTERAYRQIWNAQIPELKNTPFPFPKVIFKVMKNGSTEKIGKARLKTLSMKHGFGKVEILGFRLETKEGIFTYSAETGLCQNIKKLPLKADIFLCECGSKITKIEYGHLNPYQVGTIAKNAQVKKLVVFHFTTLNPQKNIVPEIIKSGFKGKIIVAQDFQTISA